MKTINTFISEKLKISKNKPEYTLFPTTFLELDEMINNEIKKMEIIVLLIILMYLKSLIFLIFFIQQV